MAVVIGNAAGLASAFRAARLPVVLTRADLNNPPQGRTAVSGRERPPIPDAAPALVPELDPGIDDIVLDRRGWSAFADTGLDGILHDLAVTQVVLVGLATSYGVESTARQAYDLGYSVVVVTDAINNPDAAGHAHSLTRVLPALAQLCTTDELMALLPRLPDTDKL
jgi:nicotinamidase-related amidase